MIVKNKSTGNYPINKSIQVSLDSPSNDDGYILPGQEIDLSKSISVIDLLDSSELRDGIYSGDLVFVVDNIEVDQSQSIDIYNSGATQWAKIFNPVISKYNLYEGIASGFIYAKNCLIG